MLSTELLMDSVDWPDRVLRLAAGALDRVRCPEWAGHIGRAERWADGGRPARNSQGSRLACMRMDPHRALEEAGRDLPFCAGWRALADLLGPPDLPRLPDSWREKDQGVAYHLAEHIYQSRDWSLCPVLGDLLEGAGVADQDLVTHLRSGHPHSRGCWAIDLLTGRLEVSRRCDLCHLPTTDRPVRYELLLQLEGTLVEALQKKKCDGDDLLAHLVGWELPVKATRDEPWRAHTTWGDTHCRDGYLLSLRGPSNVRVDPGRWRHEPKVALVLEREVPACRRPPRRCDPSRVAHRRVPR
jgi:hypothetical protein